MAEKNLIEFTCGDTKQVVAYIDEREFVAGDTVVLTVKKKVGDTDAIIQKTLTTFTDGQAIFEFTPSDTKDLAFGTYVYDCELTDANSKVYTFAKGRLRLTWGAKNG